MNFRNATEKSIKVAGLTSLIVLAISLAIALLLLGLIAFFGVLLALAQAASAVESALSVAAKLIPTIVLVVITTAILSFLLAWPYQLYFQWKHRRKAEAFRIDTYKKNLTRDPKSSSNRRISKPVRESSPSVRVNTIRMNPSPMPRPRLSIAETERSLDREEARLSSVKAGFGADVVAARRAHLRAAREALRLAKAEEERTTQEKRSQLLANLKPMGRAAEEHLNAKLTNMISRRDRAELRYRTA